ncbi:Mitochondrial beta-keto-acyl synthase [Sorochytrium milnesiophthora]
MPPGTQKLCRTASERYRTGIGGIDEFAATNVTLEQQGYRKISPFTIPRALTNMASGWVAMYHGLTVAGAHAIADAARLIMLDEADVVIAGASEASLSRLCIAGFAKAKALCTEYEDAPHEASRPFDRKRCGFVMGEGAGSLVMEERQHALDRGAHIYAELAGFGMSGDAHHITSPPSDGHGAALSMTRALQRAGMDLASVHHINCHATSTPLGDISEIRSIRSVFGDHAANISISATKAATGHLLGAAGAVEAIFAIKAIVEVPRLSPHWNTATH